MLLKELGASVLSLLALTESLQIFDICRSYVIFRLQKTGGLCFMSGIGPKRDEVTGVEKTT
jgi:hypothetical protein